MAEMDAKWFSEDIDEGDEDDVDDEEFKEGL